MLLKREAGGVEEGESLREGEAGVKTPVSPSLILLRELYHKAPRQEGVGLA